MKITPSAIIVGASIILAFLVVRRSPTVIMADAVAATPATGGGGGGLNCAKTVYAATGRTQRAVDNGGQTIHYASNGQAAFSRRFNANNCPYTNMEATIYFVCGGQCSGHGGTGSGGMVIKFWGTTHTDSTCCWCMTSLTCNGQCCFGGEGPHPATTTCQTIAGNVGSVAGKLIGLKGVIWALPTGGAHQEIWVDLAANGSWKKIGQRNVTACGKTKTTTKPVANQQIEFRTDCKGVDIRCATVAEIRPPATGGATAALAKAFYTTPLTPQIDDPAEQGDCFDEYYTPE